jgi:endo-1,4-beta-xylanase
MLHANYYEERLGTKITKEMAMWMRQEDPQAVLYLNDYDILTGRRLVDYVAQIRKFLDEGVPIGGIGVQGHLHGDSFDPAALQNAPIIWNRALTRSPPDDRSIANELSRCSPRT